MPKRHMDTQQRLEQMETDKATRKMFREEKRQGHALPLDSHNFLFGMQGDPVVVLYAGAHPSVFPPLITMGCVFCMGCGGSVSLPLSLCECAYVRMCVCAYLCLYVPVYLFVGACVYV